MGENEYEPTLRPRDLNEFVGQDRIREHLHVAIAAARGRNEALDHILLHGSHGLGKTTLAYIVANERGVPLRSTAAPLIQQAVDLIALLTTLEQHEVLF